MIINSLIKQGSKILKKQNIDSHQIDAELLLSKAIRKDRVFLLTNNESKVSPKKTSDYFNFILRRKQHEPLSYITKRKEFWSLVFNVNHNVLIPRPETEIIVEQVVKRFKGKGSLNILVSIKKGYNFVRHLEKKVKEKLAIEIKQIVEKNKASFAFPSQSIYVEKK